MERARILRNMMTTRHPSLADAIAAERAKALEIRDELAQLKTAFDSAPMRQTAARALVDRHYAETVPMAL